MGRSSRFANDADMALVNMVKAGDQDAFGELWKRHAGAVAAAARTFTGFDPDDVTQETFYRVLKRLEEGHGPTTAFRAYAIMTARNVAVNMARQGTLDETTGASDELFEAISQPQEDFAPQLIESSFTLSVFRTLPIRWQEALWYREVEDLPVQVFCTFLGMSENATSALLKRAREGFKQAWLAANISPDNDLNPDCRWAIAQLPRYVRGKSSAAVRKRLEPHLASCPRCAIVSEESEELHRKLALVLLPAFLGGSAGAAYLDWTRSNGASAAAGQAPNSGRRLTAAKVAKFGLIPTAVVLAGSIGGAYALSVVPASPETPRNPPTSSPETEATLSGDPSTQEPGSSSTRPERATSGVITPEPASPEPSATRAVTDAAPTEENPTPAPAPQPAPTSPIYLPSTLTAAPIDGMEAGVYPHLKGTGVPGARITLTTATDANEQLTAEILVAADGTWSYTPTKLRGTLTVTAAQSYQKSGVTYVENPVRLGTFNVGDGLRMTITQTAPNESTIKMTNFGTAVKNLVGNAKSTTLGLLVERRAPNASGELVITVPYPRTALGDVLFWQGDTSTGPYRVWKINPTV